MPNFLNVTFNKLYVPPYKFEEATISSPVSTMFNNARCIAACPEAVAKAPTPPSRAVMRSSKTFCVGFIILV